MKLVRTICVIALALVFVASAYAGTQSVKISGDLTIRGLARDDFDLNHDHMENPNGSNVPNAGGVDPTDPNPGTSDWQTWFMTTTEVQIDADLTDNVAGVIRLLNQRDWNARDYQNGDQADVWNSTTGLANQYAARDDEFDVGVDLAYIELKEFLYSPLTLRIGRQDLWFGKGFVVGANLQDPNNTILANEYTAMTSFDAIRATLDYDPWTIDTIYAKIWENDISSKDDQDLYGVNVGYVFDTYNAEAEGYWFYKDDRSTVRPRQIKEHNTVHTIGLRGSADPIENWTISAEGAYQFGDFVGFRDQAEDRSRSAYALDISGECRHFRESFAWKPVIGVEYILYSGDDEEYPTAQTTGSYGGWDPMYRGKFDTAYREFVGMFNATHMGWVGMRANYIQAYTDASFTNQHQAIVYGSLMPTDSLTIDGKVAFFWMQYDRAFLSTQTSPANSNNSTTENRKQYLGTEVDVQLTWDYTEDVSFGLLSAWFFPGSFYYDQSEDTATDLVGTVKLSF